MSTPHQNSDGGPGRDYADRDIRLGVIVKFAVGISLFTAAVFWGSKILLLRLAGQAAAQGAAPSEFATARILPPEPRLQVDEQRTIEEQQAIERRALTTYEWIDKNAGVVQIPVEKAMDLVLERGLPARPAK
jgi:hypothetical protein